MCRNRKLFIRLQKGGDSRGTPHCYSSSTSCPSTITLPKPMLERSNLGQMQVTWATASSNPIMQELAASLVNSSLVYSSEASFDITSSSRWASSPLNLSTSAWSLAFLTDNPKASLYFSVKRTLVSQHVIWSSLTCLVALRTSSLDEAFPFIAWKGRGSSWLRPAPVASQFDQPAGLPSGCPALPWPRQGVGSSQERKWHPRMDPTLPPFEGSIPHSPAP